MTCFSAITIIVVLYQVENYTLSPSLLIKWESGHVWKILEMIFKLLPKNSPNRFSWLLKTAKWHNEYEKYLDLKMAKDAAVRKCIKKKFHVSNLFCHAYFDTHNLLDSVSRFLFMKNKPQILIWLNCEIKVRSSSCWPMTTYQVQAKTRFSDNKLGK